MTWEPIDGETPVDPSQLRDRSIKSRRELHVAEAEAIRPVILKYLAARPSTRLAPFHYSWILALHGEMFAPVWTFAGKTRQRDLNIGVCLASNSVTTDATGGPSRVLERRLPDASD